MLPLAEQIMRLEVGIGELLAFHSAVCEKADIEKIYHLKYDCIFLIQGILVQIPYLCLIYTVYGRHITTNRLAIVDILSLMYADIVES
ncbi:MAG: hypothetical protein WAJ93_04990, partial [Candidatus Nitrosopolaris sp.]